MITGMSRAVLGLRVLIGQGLLWFIEPAKKSSWSVDPMAARPIVRAMVADLEERLQRLN